MSFVEACTDVHRRIEIVPQNLSTFLVVNYDDTLDRLDIISLNGHTKHIFPRSTRVSPSVKLYKETVL